MDETVVALFDSLEDAQAAVRDMQDAGFDPSRLSLMKADRLQQDDKGDHPKVERVRERRDVDQGRTVEKGVGIGAVVGGAAGLLAGIASLVFPGVGVLLVAGPLLDVVAGAGLGAATGGLAGALARSGVPNEEAREFAAGVRSGNTLVMASVPRERAADVRRILDAHHPAHIRERPAALGNVDELNTSQPTRPQVSDDAGRFDDYGPGREALRDEELRQRKHSTRPDSGQDQP